MNYDLALKLKEAGFPFRGTTDDTDEYRFGLVVSGGIHVIYPTLEELIEACGRPFSSLHSTVGGFIANGHKEIEIDDDSDPWRLFQGIGKSPEEAVANLWLELNNK